MKLSQLQALAAVAEHGNFSSAAFSLDLSQSAISHAIAALEEELGVPLLARGRFGARPTPVGERVLVHARQMLHLTEAIAQEAQAAKGLLGGTVRVASFRSAATHLLPRCLMQFQQRFPKISVTLTEHSYDGVEQALREGQADIGLTAMPTTAGFQVWELLQDEYVVLLPPESVSTTVQRDDLTANAYIISSEEDCCLTEVQQHWLDMTGQPLKIAYMVREDSTIVSLVAQGLACAIMPELAAQPLPPGVQVCSLPKPLKRVIVAAVLAEAMHIPAVYAFVDALRGTGLFGKVS